MLPDTCQQAVLVLIGGVTERDLRKVLGLIEFYFGTLTVTCLFIFAKTHCSTIIRQALIGAGSVQ